MLKKSFSYLGVVYLLQILNIVLNILLIRNLSLDALGQITLAKVYFQFMDYLHLGSRFVMDRYLPTSNEKEGKLITNIAVLVSFVLSVVAIIVVYFFFNNSWVVIIFMISGSIFAQGNIYKTYFRAKEKTKDMITIVLVMSLLPLLLQLITIVFFSFKIFVFSFLLSYTVAFIFLVYKFRLIRLMTFSSFIIKVKSIYDAAFLLFLTYLVAFFSFSIDKILLEKYKGSVVLGEYSIILFVFATLLIIPGTLAELVFPKIIQKVTSSSEIIHLKEMSFVFFSTLFSIIIANLFMDYFIIKFTNYSYLLHYLHLVSWAALPYALTSIMYHTLNALDQRKTIFKINFLVFLLYVGYLYYVFFSLNKDVLQELVWGRILYGILLVTLYVYSLKKYHENLILR